MASVRDIARRTGVSITTVSRVLNNHPNVSADVREAVLAAAQRSHYVPSVGRRSTNNIALMYTGERSLGSPFDSNLLNGITNALEGTDLDLLILESRRARATNETFSHMFMRKGVRGAILRTTFATRETCLAIASEGFPVVVVGDRFPDTKIHCIWSDSATTSREAVDHLVEQGHRRIAVCVNVVDDSDHADRLLGYTQSLTAHGIEVDEQLIWRFPADRRGGVQVIKRLQAMGEPPTAVYVTDPLTCVGALAEARRVGVRIPEDLSIVGFDDGDLRITLCPQLTAICQNAAELGAEAFKMLEKLMTSEPGEGAPGRSLKCWFEIHETTAPRE